MSDERMEQNRQPEKADVVFFSPEMLRGGSAPAGAAGAAGELPPGGPEW